MTTVPAPGSAPTQLLWAATVRGRLLADRLAVARAAGFTAQSVFPSDITAWLAEGRSPAEVRDEARAGGVPSRSSIR